MQIWYAHELLHAAKHYCNHFGIDDEETECYMLGYLMKIYTDLLENAKHLRGKPNNKNIKKLCKY